jgi:NAD(P)H-dependent FMN reductase
MKIKIILGSTRQGRFGDKPAQWIFDLVKQREGVEAELLDLRDYPMPFFDEPVSPSQIKEPYSNPVVQKWTAKIAEADGFIILSPEYNHGYSAVLKNAIDYVGKEWHQKAVGFVSWGSVSGARAIEQLREVAVELELASIRPSIHIPLPVYMAVLKEPVPANPELFQPIQENAGKFIDQLLWWTKALKTARDSK